MINRWVEGYKKTNRNIDGTKGKIDSERKRYIDCRIRDSVRERDREKKIHSILKT